MKKTDDIVGVVSQQHKYKIEAKYSKEAIEKKLIRFTIKGNRKSFEISADELISVLADQVNQDLLSPTFVETQRINVVQVSRQIVFQLEKDMKKGDKIRSNYVHMYPLEFAIIEEAMKIAKIEGNTGFELTKEFIDDVKSKLQPRMEEFTKKFYDSFNLIKEKESDIKK